MARKNRPKPRKKESAPISLSNVLMDAAQTRPILLTRIPKSGRLFPSKYFSRKASNCFQILHSDTTFRGCDKSRCIVHCPQLRQPLRKPLHCLLSTISRSLCAATGRHWMHGAIKAASHPAPNLFRTSALHASDHLFQVLWRKF